MPRMSSFRAAVVATIAASLSAATASASHRIFVTSTTFDGDLGGLEGADALCQARADAGARTQALGWTWRALLSIHGVVDAKDRLVWYGPLHDVTGLLVTNDPGTWPWVSGGDGGSTIGVDENGSPPPDNYVWTGSTVDGVAKGAAFDCNDWTDATSSNSGWAGETASFPSASWIDSFANACDSDFFSLYCVSEALILADDFEGGTVCEWSAHTGSSDDCTAG